MRKLEIFCLILITGALLVLLGELSKFVIDARASLNTLSTNANALVITANETAIETRGAAMQAKLAAAAVAATANEQRAYWQKTSLETYKTMASLRLTIVRTDRSLNDTLAPQLAATLAQTGNLSTTAAATLQRTMDQLQPTLANLGAASAGAAAAMNDPAIHDTFSHLDETSTHLDDTSARAALAAAETVQIAGHVNDASRDVAAYIHRMTAPARGVWTFFKELLSIAAQARQAGGI